jgi:O-antigen/teichoic acid export membrane protein
MNLRCGMDPQPEKNVSAQLKAVAVITLAVITGLLIWLPASRRFLLGVGIAILICVVIGIVVAAILHLWHKHKPLKDEDIESKRPLGLQ